MKVKFWGVRGSIPSPSKETVKYGGNTACVEIRNSNNELVIIDAGTGIRYLGKNLLTEFGFQNKIEGLIAISHTHWDHIQGLPFFVPFFLKQNEFRIIGPKRPDSSLEDVLKMQMHYDYFPLNFKSLPATLNFEDIRETEILYKNFKITSKILNHAMLGTVLGYKIESDGKSVVYISDHEGYKLFFPAASDKNQKIVDALERKHIDFLKNTDLIIHDAQYTSEDYSKRVGWGHSSIDYVIETALNAETKRLALIHYDPDYSDSKIDEIQDLYVNLLKEKKSDLKLIASYEGLEINLIEEKNTNE